MEEQVLTPLAVTHLLQHTLRSLCIHENSQWVYAVFWRILPRNYPPPKWDSHGSAYDRSRGNRRNWILVWEDGFCNFAASTAGGDCGGGSGGGGGGGSSSSSIYGNCEYQQYQGLQPELFFKMSHEIYNYGEGLIGKVAADHGHKWIHREPNHDHNQEINFLSTWQNSADQQPRTWEAQFQSGIKTIALIAVREGVVQLGAVHKVVEDLSYVVLLRKKFSYIENIPGVLLPHPSSAAYPFKPDNNNNNYNSLPPPDHHQQPPWHYQSNLSQPPPELLYDQFNQPVPMRITPSMSSLEALLAKLPSVMPPPGSAAAAAYCEEQQQQTSMYMSRPMELMGMEKIAKQEVDDEDGNDKDMGGGESSSSMSSYHHHQHYNYYPDLKM